MQTDDSSSRVFRSLLYKIASEIHAGRGVSGEHPHTIFMSVDCADKIRREASELFGPRPLSDGNSGQNTICGVPFTVIAELTGTDYLFAYRPSDD